jgi:DNA-directed RNA polymerase alpha subunit
MKKKKIQKRDQEIFDLRQQGKTFRQIASLYNISASRAAFIYHREKEKYDNADKWPPLKIMLSTRTQNGLINYFNYLGYKDILNNPRKLAELNERDFLKIKNLGKKSARELFNALHQLGYIDAKGLKDKML